MQVIHSNKAPEAIGPYSQAIRCGNMVYCSGQIPLHPETGEVVGTDIAAQTRQALKNLISILDTAESGLQNVVKTTVYLSDIENFSRMNTIYAEYFGDNKPARACVEVSRLPKDVLVEIDAIAVSFGDYTF